MAHLDGDCFKNFQQLALADWEGRPAMEPTVWVPGIPLEMTVAAPASHKDLVVSSSGQQQLKLVEGSIDHEYAVEVFKQTAQSFEDKHDQMEMKIHLFPASMEDLAAKYAAPNVVSIGPYHHRRTPALQQMESTKHVAAWHFINDSGCSVEEVYGAVCEVADEARSHYDKDKVRDLGDNDFKPMMFYDGCFLLQSILHCSGGAVDPVLSSAFSSDNNGIARDVVLLENQLPWVVVETLMSFMPTPPDLVKFTGNVKDSLQARQQLEDVPIAWDSSYTPPHLLGLLRYYIVGSTHVGTAQVSSKPLSEKAKKFSISVSAIELAEIGIEITATKSTAGLKEMGIDSKASLISVELCLAPVSLDHGNASFLVNMAALELCTTPDFFDYDEDRSTVCSYLCLLGMVTDSETDVQELRKKHILQGGAGLTNGDALDLFTSLEKHLRPGSAYLRIMLDIENYKIHRSVRTKVYRLQELQNHRHGGDRHCWVWRFPRDSQVSQVSKQSYSWLYLLS
uniref:Uncharacterized protein n=1 Tax=Avena sativa TaxID=4498 RepID=A0ACD5UVN5_AVESA